MSRHQSQLFFRGYHHAAKPNVIYREECDGEPGNLKKITDFDDDSKAAFRVKAFIGGRIVGSGKDARVEDVHEIPPTGERTDVEGATYIEFEIPEDYRFSLEPVLFSFVSYAARKRESNYIPFSLAEETLGATFLASVENTELLDPRLVKFAMAMPGPSAPRVEDLFRSSKQLKVGMHFDAHSLPAGEGGAVVWKDLKVLEALSGKSPPE